MIGMKIMNLLMNFKKGALIGASMFILLLCVSGCTIDGGIADESKNKHMTCTDTRDGETFGFNSNNITNIRIGIGSDSSIDVVDDFGTKRTLSSSMELFIKCVE